MNNKTSSKDTSFAEVVESNLSTWSAQCWDWRQSPTFGSLITTSHGSLKIFGIVQSITTGSMDPVRQPIAYQKTEEELLIQQPQIFEFLQTNFTNITVGYKQDNKMFYHLAQKPPRIHAFVQDASDDEYKLFFENEQFLHLLFNMSNQIFNLDELLLALLKQLITKKLLTKQNLNNFIENFAMLRKNDYQTVKIFLQRTEQLLKA